MFQGEPFEEEDYCEAICAVRQAIDRYFNPRTQLEPLGKRGYIELRAVKNLRC